MSTYSTLEAKAEINEILQQVRAGLRVLRATLAREGAASVEGDLLTGGIIWLYPNRPLTKEYRRIPAESSLKGADLRRQHTVRPVSYVPGWWWT